MLTRARWLMGREAALVSCPSETKCDHLGHHGVLKRITAAGLQPLRVSSQQGRQKVGQSDQSRSEPAAFPAEVLLSFHQTSNSSFPLMCSSRGGDEGLF